MIEEAIDLKKILRRYGLKSTPQRIAVYTAMRELGHASADMVFQQASAKLTTLTVATVYNVLESFVQVGLLQRRMSSNNKMYMDVNTYNHCHLYCEETHTFRDYDDPELMLMIHDHFRNKRIRGFDLHRIDVQLVGRKRRVGRSK
jgi:Fur family peroxide stress response transcriptional regulator